jgi:NAD(P)-dependent dehydrogenase (short-subunit alcohol dehydrogenase family)
LSKEDRKVALVTGSSRGIGAAIATRLASDGFAVIVNYAGRAEDAEALAARLTQAGASTLALQADVSDPQAVTAMFDRVEAAFGGVDVLVNNAGIMAVPYALTVDGFESQIGTNHLGHFALTNLLLPKLTDRVVTVSSGMHLIGAINLEDLNWNSRSYSPWRAYGQSKLANLLFTSELQRRLDAAGSPLKAHTVHPGYSATNLQGNTGRKVGDALMTFGNKLATDADFGARQTLYAAAKELPGDSFVGPRYGMWGPTGPTPFRSPLARDREKAADLWELSEQLTDTKFAL